MFWQNPLLGVGVNNFYNNINLFKDNVFLIQPVHNIFLLILSETGIIGLVGFLFILLKSFLSILKKQNKYLLFSLLAIIFLGMFDHYFLTLQQGQLMLAFIIGASFSK
jgi:O-antigen ligase